MMLMLITTTPPPRAVAAGSPGGLHLKAEPLRLIDRINASTHSASWLANIEDIL